MVVSLMLGMNRNIQSLFDPSMKILSRVMKVILDNNYMGKTALALQTNTNYARLAKLLAWLEEKNLVESTIVDGKAKVQLSMKGRDFFEQYC